MKDKKKDMFYSISSFNSQKNKNMVYYKKH